MSGEVDQDVTYVIRTCDKDMKGHGGFQWPESGFVEAPDWDPDPEITCGSGLHGLEWGQGDARLLDWDQDAKWLVVKVLKSEGFLAGKDKCRYRRGEVVFAGGMVGACQKIREVGYTGSALPGEPITAGYMGQATAGDRGLIILKRWDGSRFRAVVLYPGEDGIKANTKYKLDDDGKPVEAVEEKS